MGAKPLWTRTRSPEKDGVFASMFSRVVGRDRAANYYCRKELEAFERHERIDSGFKSPARKPVDIMAVSPVGFVLGALMAIK
jgi:hypothetical protein